MRLSAEASQALAAAYALGTLRGPARRRLEQMSHADASLAELLRTWQLALAPLAENVPAIQPPARVWTGIASRTAPSTAHPLPSTALWRALGLVAGGLATVLLAFFVWTSSVPRDEPVFVAVLTEQNAVPRAVASLHEAGTLKVRIVKPWKNVEGRSLELWALPKDGAPRSLGLVANIPGDTVIRIARDDPRVRDASALAVSLEPAGGSPTKAPTGPILCSGSIAAVSRT